jgi:hypothetical protein
MDVGVDTHDFRPWQFDEIIQIMRRRRRSSGLTSLRWLSGVGLGHEFKVRPTGGIHWDGWALAGVLTLAVTAYFCLRGFPGPRIAVLQDFFRILLVYVP